jgi:hypothetical protein
MFAYQAPSQTQVATKGYTLAEPTAPAVDQNGDLFIGGLSECSRHRGCANYRVPGDELGAQWQWKSHLPGGLGSLLSQRISPIVDRKNTVFVGLTGPTGGHLIGSLWLWDGDQLEYHWIAGGVHSRGAGEGRIDRSLLRQ